MAEMLLYSINTTLAFQIQRTFYNNIHFVWCTAKYDRGWRQPASSNPLSIARCYLRDIYSGDNHSSIVMQNRQGLKRGAMVKRRMGIIDEVAESEIITMADMAPLSAFLPLLYIIPFAPVAALCEKVPEKRKASPDSIEYLISELPRNCFDIVDIGRTVPYDVNGVDLL